MNDRTSRFVGVSLALGAILASAALLPRAAADNPPVGPGAVTFSKDVAPILNQHCGSCHHPGDATPFSLLTFADAQKRAGMIAAVTQSRYMPPWKADSHGEFLDENRLTDTEIATIKQWVDLGAPEGEKADRPQPAVYPPDWSLGQPDLVLEPPQSYTVDAEGRDEYHSFVLPTNLAEDRWVSAIELKPGNRTVVHHVIVYLDSTGTARKLAQGSPEMGYKERGGGLGFFPSGALGGWAPGNLPRRLPDGVGIRLPRGADVVLQVHYHRSGKVETDRTKIGIYFCKGPVDKQLYDFPLAAPLDIPAGEAHYETKGAIPVPADATLYNIMPHMHLLGKQMTVTVQFPNGTQQTLIHVPDWDFNWQETYTYREPIKIPRGSWIRLTAVYDNSGGNPHNPNDPPERVTWGEQTTNEMCIAFLGFTVDREHLGKTSAGGGQ